MVLSKTNDVYLINCAESKFSSLARTGSANERDISCNGSTGVRIETKNQQEPISNGLTKPVVIPSVRTSSQMVTAAIDPLPKIPSPTENGDVKNIN